MIILLFFWSDISFVETSNLAFKDVEQLAFEGYTRLTFVGVWAAGWHGLIGASGIIGGAWGHAFLFFLTPFQQISLLENHSLFGGNKSCIILVIF